MRVVVSVPEGLEIDTVPSLDNVADLSLSRIDVEIIVYDGDRAIAVLRIVDGAVRAITLSGPP